MSTRNSLLGAVADHPWTSLQDLMLIIAAMSVATLFTLEYDLLRYSAQLSDEARKITVAEMMFLTVGLAVSITIFIQRRLHEQREQARQQSTVDSEVRSLREQALRDPLTGLPNRRALLAKLGETEAQLDGRRHVFFMLDLNDFKRVNDLYGHAVGDRVLQVVVERFKRVARPSDVLGRLGGDEFAVLSYDVDRSSAASIGERYLATLERAIWVEGCGHQVGVSIGAAFIPEDGASAQEIVRNADLAMYRAKKGNGSSLAFYQSDTDASSPVPLAGR